MTELENTTRKIQVKAHILRTENEMHSLFHTGSSEPHFQGTVPAHSITIEELTATDRQIGVGKKFEMHYSTFSSQFGNLFIASTIKGISYLSFYDEPVTEIRKLTALFPDATLNPQKTVFHKDAELYLNGEARKITLHLAGTPFQLKIWKALLHLPMGHLISYGQLANDLGLKNSSRATGTAIAANPVAMLIPCHRVIRKNGETGGYMWGPERKKRILEWEISGKDLS